jgi:hypothetical protein
MPIDHKKLLLWLALVAAAGPALAELGGNAASVAADQQRMMAQQRSTLAAATYTVQESQTPDGTTVREYVSSAGVVFAVTWNGPQPPDLRQLFGSKYFAEWQDAAKAQPARRGPLRVHQSDLVVHSGGHMRAYSGQAYVPQLVPAGVSVDELQ